MANTSSLTAVARDGGVVTARTGTFDSIGQSPVFQPAVGAFNVFIDIAGSGSVQLKRSRDGATFLPLTGSGTPLYVWTADASEIVVEVEPGISYLLDCLSVSGTISYSMSQFT